MPRLTPNDPGAGRCEDCRFWWHDGRAVKGDGQCRFEMPPKTALSHDGCGQFKPIPKAKGEPAGK